jgi:hypothetical protein
MSHYPASAFRTKLVFVWMGRCINRMYILSNRLSSPVSLRRGSDCVRFQSSQHLFESDFLLLWNIELKWMHANAVEWLHTATYDNSASYLWSIQWFMQDSATSHTASVVSEFFHAVSGSRVITHRDSERHICGHFRPPRPDLHPCDIFSQSFIKETSFLNDHDLRAMIVQLCRKITEDVSSCRYKRRSTYIRSCSAK